MTTVRFARLSFRKKLSHYTPDYNELERRKEALLDVINWDTDINAYLRDTENKNLIGRGDWTFAGVEHNEYLISGKIAKDRVELNKVKDEEIRDYREEEAEDADISFFLIDVESSVMAYEYKRNVGPKAPYLLLQSVFNNYHEGEEEVEIEPLTDKRSWDEAIAEIVKIERLSFTNLRPTNPNSTDNSENMDKFLKHGGVQNLTLSAQSDETGMDIDEMPLFDSGIDLAQEGYGRATVEGEDKDGNEREISTDEVTIEGEVSDDTSYDRKKRKLLEEIEAALASLESDLD